MPRTRTRRATARSAGGVAGSVGAVRALLVAVAANGAAPLDGAPAEGAVSYNHVTIFPHLYHFKGSKGEFILNKNTIESKRGKDTEQELQKRILDLPSGHRVEVSIGEQVIQVFDEDQNSCKGFSGHNPTSPLLYSNSAIRLHPPPFLTNKLFEFPPASQ